ncbi:hypothetical protein BRADI_2g43280v3 [Brachypodium distachyon]|uniref:Uncharacterized protein n=1 Tax=Brachypodium distachyon TaxID=15368 RepID=I1HPB7_BRADI|nr:hypothetical protein BRADI_2g43280v3 [Brachypodium distachyon]
MAEEDVVAATEAFRLLTLGGGEPAVRVGAAAGAQGLAESSPASGGASSRATGVNGAASTGSAAPGAPCLVAIVAAAGGIAAGAAVGFAGVANALPVGALLSALIPAGARGEIGGQIAPIAAPAS